MVASCVACVTVCAPIDSKEFSVCTGLELHHTLTNYRDRKVNIARGYSVSQSFHLIVIRPFLGNNNAVQLLYDTTVVFCT